METIEYTGLRDRSEWGAGPWDSEPQDKVQWQDAATGFPCLAVRNRMGSWCGYVGVAEGHPWFEREYDGVEESGAISVHGGPTFAGFCQEHLGEGGICHVPGPGEPDRVWWIGFDCAHYMDTVPELEAGWPRGGTYKTLGYVRSEVEGLALQAKYAAEDRSKMDRPT